MQYLGLKSDDLQKLGGIHTAREIDQQPALWQDIFSMMTSIRPELSVFLKEAQKTDKVILTGAGTSAFIGESLTGSFFQHFHQNVQAISTTHLVSHPYDYFSKTESVLMISFARSGNSPESTAAVKFADSISKQAYHLIITCNSTGALALHPSPNKNFIILLPDEANDRSLAMTSSYSCMLLAGMLVAQSNITSQQIQLAARYGKRLLTDYLPLLKNLAALPFQRAVFLGSGPLYGTANESHLKLQELSDGNVICKHDSFLGFRHGPKAVVDNDTLMVYFLSNSDYVSKYESDLIFAMEKGRKALAQVLVTESLNYALPVEHQILLTENGVSLAEELLTLPYVLVGQILGFFKSLNEGLSPDQPSTSGAISRVVEGVTIYELP